jgi:topoisomerase-4 subunit A
MTDLPNEDDIIGMTLYAPEQKFVVAASDGRGFIVKSEDVLAQTKNGKQILNVNEKTKAAVFAPVAGDMIAVIGTNRKLLLFPVADLPEMARGRGVILQKYSGGQLSDVKTFVLKDGLTWQSGDRTRTETDIRNWKGERAQAGRITPNGFNRSNKFS